MSDKQRKIFPIADDQRCTCGHTAADHNTPDAIFASTACLHDDLKHLCECESFTPEKQTWLRPSGACSL